MIEKGLYQAISTGRNHFHSAILTSYSFDFHHFENQVLRELKNRWITNINVLIDERMLDCVLGLTSGNLKYLSQSYSVTGINSKHAFHPKISLFIGDDELLLLFGSGNITPGGHGKNHELFTALYADQTNKSQLPLILEAWEYIQTISAKTEGYVKQRINHTTPSSCNLYSQVKHSRHSYISVDDQTQIALLYNEKNNSGIFDQLSNLIPQSEIKEITIACPYYDEDGEALNHIAQTFSNATIKAYLPSEAGLPPLKIENNQRIKFLSWDDTERGKIEIPNQTKYYRKLHSKVIHFKSDTHEYLLIGSANTTRYGLGLNQEHMNDEFSALYKTTRKDLLKELGICGKEAKIPFNHLDRKSVTEPGQARKSNKKIRLVSCDLNSNRLIAYFNILKPIEEASLVLYSDKGEIIKTFEFEVTDEHKLAFRLNDEQLSKNPGFIEIQNSHESPLSNKQLINITDKLINTDPGKKSRQLRQIIGAMNIGEANEFDIMEYLNNMHSQEDTSNPKPCSRGNSYRSKNEEDNDLEELTYEDAIKRKKHQVGTNPHQINTNTSARLWESLSKLISSRTNSQNDELIDEEEEAESKTSRERTKKNISDITELKNKSEFDKRVDKIKLFSENYIKNLKTLSHQKNHILDIIDLSHFLLVTHLLTSLTYFSTYRYTETKKGNNKNKTIQHEKRLDELYIKLILDILNQFTLVCMNSKFDSYSKDEVLKNKMKVLLNRTIAHFWLYLRLAKNRSTHDVEHRNISLISLNTLDIFGEPNSTFNDIIKKLAEFDGNNHFSPRRVIALKDAMVHEYNSLETSLEFIKIPDRGICSIKEYDSKTLYYKGLFNSYKIAMKKLKSYGINIAKFKK